VSRPKRMRRYKPVTLHRHPEVDGEEPEVAWIPGRIINHPVIDKLQPYRPAGLVGRRLLQENALRFRLT
jgi:hypothetical protein